MRFWIPLLMLGGIEAAGDDELAAWEAGCDVKPIR